MRSKNRYIFVLAESSLTPIPDDLAKRGPKWLAFLDSVFHHRYINLYLSKEREKYGRPDIVHRALLTILDSPILKHIDAEIYVHTLENIVIKINPETRIPRHYIRFLGLMRQLFKEKPEIKFEDKILISKIGKVEFKDFVNSLRGDKGYIIGLSEEGKLYSLKKRIIELEAEGKNPLVFIVGAFPRGRFRRETAESFDEPIAVSEHVLSTSATICRLMCSLEEILVANKQNRYWE